MKSLAEIGARVAETLARWRPSWVMALQWAGWIGFVLFVVLPALLSAKIVLKIVMLLVAW